jgi:hypothetical protein
MRVGIDAGEVSDDLNRQPEYICRERGFRPGVVDGPRRTTRARGQANITLRANCVAFQEYRVSHRRRDLRRSRWSYDFLRCRISDHAEGASERERDREQAPTSRSLFGLLTLLAARLLVGEQIILEGDETTHRKKFSLLDSKVFGIDPSRVDADSCGYLVASPQACSPSHCQTTRSTCKINIACSDTSTCQAFVCAVYCVGKRFQRRELMLPRVHKPRNLICPSSEQCAVAWSSIIADALGLSALDGIDSRGT